MKLWIPILVLGIAVITAALQTPASYVVAKAIPESLPVKIYEVSGTVSSGTIGRLSAKTVEIDDIHWTLNPGDLLRLAVGIEAQARIAGNPVSGHFSAGVLSPLAATDVRASASLPDLKDLFKIPFLPLEGDLFVRIDTISADTEWLTALQGHIQLVDAQWALGQTRAPLGEFQAELSIDDDGIVTAELSDVDATVNVEGQLTVSPDRSYALSARVRATPGTPTIVANNLRGLGRPDPEGWYTLTYSGQMQ